MKMFSCNCLCRDRVFSNRRGDRLIFVLLIVFVFGFSFIIRSDERLKGFLSDRLSGGITTYSFLKWIVHSIILTSLIDRNRTTTTATIIDDLLYSIDFYFLFIRSEDKNKTVLMICHNFILKRILSRWDRNVDSLRLKRSSFQSKHQNESSCAVSSLIFFFLFLYPFRVCIRCPLRSLWDESMDYLFRFLVSE